MIRVGVALIYCIGQYYSQRTTYQAPPSLGFSRLEYWSRVPLPSPIISLHHIIFIHSSLDEGMLLPPFGYCEQCNCEHGCSNICLNPVFHFLMYLPKKYDNYQLSYGNSTFDFLRSCLSVFLRGCSILHSHQQCKRIPVSPHSP